MDKISFIFIVLIFFASCKQEKVLNSSELENGISISMKFIHHKDSIIALREYKSRGKVVFKLKEKFVRKDDFYLKKKSVYNLNGDLLCNLNSPYFFLKDTSFLFSFNDFEYPITSPVGSEDYKITIRKKSKGLFELKKYQSEGMGKDNLYFEQYIYDSLFNFHEVTIYNNEGVFVLK